MPKLKTLFFGAYAFQFCHHVVFESDLHGGVVNE